MYEIPFDQASEVAAQILKRFVIALDEATPRDCFEVTLEMSKLYGIETYSLVEVAQRIHQRLAPEDMATDDKL